MYSRARSISSGARGGGIPERLDELRVVSVDLRVDFGAVTRRFSFVS